MLPIRNGSSFSLLQQRLRALIVCNFATKKRFLSEKAKFFSIFLQITEVLQMEIGAQKKEMKLNLRCFISEPTLKSKACLKCLYFTKIISALCCYLEYFSYLYTIN